MLHAAAEAGVLAGVAVAFVGLLLIRRYLSGLADVAAAFVLVVPYFVFDAYPYVFPVGLFLTRGVARPARTAQAAMTARSIAHRRADWNRRRRCHGRPSCASPRSRTLCMSAYVLLHVAQSSANPLDFIQPGADGPSAEVIRADFPDDELPAGVGLDGQQYYVVARDPMHVRDNADHLDRPRYRMQRPVFPLLAWALHPMGGGTGLIVAFVVVGIVALFVGCVATGALSTALGGPPWAAAFFAATPGAFWSLRVTVADTLALALASVRVAFAARSRSPPRRRLRRSGRAHERSCAARARSAGCSPTARGAPQFMAGVATAAMVGWAACCASCCPPIVPASTSSVCRSSASSGPRRAIGSIIRSCGVARRP